MKTFFKKLYLLIEGKLPDYDEYLSIVTKLKESNEELLSLYVAQKNEKNKISIPVSGFDDLMHEPSDTKERQQYAMRVSEFYDDILSQKIYTSISEIRQLLATVGVEVGLPQNMTRNEYDFFLRGMEAGLWKVHDWATILQGELKNK